MFKKNHFKMSLLLFIFLFLPYCFANKVGIIGDIHCNLAAVDSAVSQMKKDKVTDIIVTGDLINYDSSCPQNAIQQIHDKLIQVVPHNKLYVIPGNWEDPNSAGGGPKQKLIGQMNATFGSRMLSQSCITPSTISIDGKNIRVTHEPPIDHAFSQHIDSTKSSYARFNPDFTPHRKVPEILPNKNIDLDIFGDSHVRTAFFTTDGVPVINPGALISGNKKTGSTSYATYDTQSSQVLFYNPEAPGNKLILAPETVTTPRTHQQIQLVGGIFDASKTPKATTALATTTLYCAPTAIPIPIPGLQIPDATSFFKHLSKYLLESINETAAKKPFEKQDLSLLQDLINNAWLCRQDPKERILELLQKAYWNSSRFKQPERSLFHLQNAIAKYLAKSTSAGNTYFNRSQTIKKSDFKTKFKDQLHQSTTKYSVPMPLTTVAPTTTQDKNSQKLIKVAEAQINSLIDSHWDKNRQGQAEPKTAAENIRRIKDILLNDPTSPFVQKNDPVRTHIINALNRMMLRDL